MYKNNNKKAIARVARGLTKKSKARNTLTVIAVALTTFLMFSFFSVALNQVFDFVRHRQSDQVFFTAAGALMIVFFLMVTGYLVIYNIINISVTRDIRFYGLLKTIGATPKQIKAVIRKQSYQLALCGILIGLAVGAATVTFILPAVMTYLSASGENSLPYTSMLHPLIFAFAALFAFLTVVISTRKPAKRAGRLSPVEALRYSEADDVPKKKSGKKVAAKRWGIFGLARRTVFRHKGRVAVTVLSISLGIFTYLLAASFIGSLDVDNYMKAYYPHEYTMYMNYGNAADEKPSERPLTSAQAGKIAAGVEKMEDVKYKRIVRGGKVALDFDADLFEPIVRAGYEWESKHRESASGKEEMPSYEAYRKNIGEEYAKAGSFNSTIYVIGEEELRAYNKKQGANIDVDAFMDGKLALVKTGTDQMYAGTVSTSQDAMIGKEISFAPDGSSDKTSVTIAGFVPAAEMHFSSESHVGLAPASIYISEKALDKYDTKGDVMAVFADPTPGKTDDVTAKMKKLVSKADPGDGFVFWVAAEVMGNFITAMTVLKVLTGGISVILFTIGLMNFINIMIAGVMMRRRELAVMESLGMTKPQVNKLLTVEGLCYAGLTMLFILTVGNGIIYYVSTFVEKIANYAVFKYPLTDVILIAALLFVICAAVPRIVYKITSKESVVERLSAL
ncbi:MAG: ABC transporter permease [Clostridiales Family XIII bacterium]|jgi:putative ABC transport system permease protein|nr:ABC transporter permease [Clostridiales Family XIII bacterium]